MMFIIPSLIRIFFCMGGSHAKKKMYSTSQAGRSIIFIIISNTKRYCNFPKGALLGRLLCQLLMDAVSGSMKLLMADASKVGRTLLLALLHCCSLRLFPRAMQLRWEEELQTPSAGGRVKLTLCHFIYYSTNFYVGHACSCYTLLKEINGVQKSTQKVHFVSIIFITEYSYAVCLWNMSQTLATIFLGNKKWQIDLKTFKSMIATKIFRYLSF